jgi:hypothetical protein
MSHGPGIVNAKRDAPQYTVLARFLALRRFCENEPLFAG